MICYKSPLRFIVFLFYKVRVLFYSGLPVKCIIEVKATLLSATLIMLANQKQLQVVCICQDTLRLEFHRTLLSETVTSLELLKLPRDNSRL